MENYICRECFKNVELKNFVEQFGKFAKEYKCEVCGSSTTYHIEFKIVGEYIYNQIIKNLRLLTEDYWDDISKTYRHSKMGWIIRTESIIGVMSDYNILNISDYNKYKDVSEKLIKAYNPSIDIYKEFCSKYTDDEEYESAMRFSWDQFVNQVKYSSRFNINIRNEYFHGFDDLLCCFETYIQDETLYRVRLNVDCDFKKSREYYEELLAPAPKHLTKENRLSPRGISYMYLSETINTALAECRAVIGDIALIGTFKPAKRLKLFDLSRGRIQNNIFDKNFNSRLVCYSSLLEKISLEISKPVRENDDELIYIPSQVFAEYIRGTGFDGIIFKSSLTNKKNYVLFYGNDSDQHIMQHPKIPSFINALRLKEHKIVSIKPMEINYNTQEYGVFDKILKRFN
jgi:hypothetical protein